MGQKLHVERERQTRSPRHIRVRKNMKWRDGATDVNFPPVQRDEDGRRQRFDEEWPQPKPAPKVLAVSPEQKPANDRDTIARADWLGMLARPGAMRSHVPGKPIHAGVDQC